MKTNMLFRWDYYLENNEDLKKLCDHISILNSPFLAGEIKDFKTKIDFRVERDKKFEEIFSKINET